MILFSAELLVTVTSTTSAAVIFCCFHNVASSVPRSHTYLLISQSTSASESTQVSGAAALAKDPNIFQNLHNLSSLHPKPSLQNLDKKIYLLFYVNVEPACQM